MSDFTGDVEFQALGKTWTLKMGTKAMRKIEAAAKKPMPVIGKELADEDKASIDLITKVFWGALQHHHPDLELDDCDDILDDLGLANVGPLLNEAFQSAEPKKGGDARPQKATAGSTGRR